MAAAHGDDAGAAAGSPARQALLGQAEAALARGDTAGAGAAFDRAAAMSHDADTEMGIVRTQLQRGDYRRALSFAAHTAGGHADVPAASALYAWLLAVGGQPTVAQTTLDKALQRAPQDPLLSATQALLATPGAVPGGALLARPHRLAPEALALDGTPPPSTARVLGTGLLLDDGRHGLVPLRAVDGGHALWVRDGLGRSSAARLERRLDALGLALVQLDAALPGPSMPLASRDAFAGSPGQVLAFGPGGEAEPAWPWLHAGFIGPARALSTDAPSPRSRLGITVPAGSDGAPVFDLSGRCIGVVGDGPLPTLLSASALRQALGPSLVPPAPDTTPSRLPTDALYEQGLRTALQVIVAVPRQEAAGRRDQ